MGSRHELLDRVQRIQSERSRLENLASDRPDGWKKDYATGRLALQEGLSALARAGSLIPRDDKLGSPAAAFHKLMSQYTVTLANHQARWPVVLITNNDEGYRISAAQVDEVFRQLSIAIRGLPAS